MATAFIYRLELEDGTSQRRGTVILFGHRRSHLCLSMVVAVGSPRARGNLRVRVRRAVKT